jgi:membrane-associated phospholipid phosphatase
MRRYISSLYAGDSVTILFLTFLSCINIIFSSRIAEWWLLIVINTAVSAIIIWVAYHSHHKVRLLQFFHGWYFILIIIFVFKEIYFMNRAIHFWRDYDTILIAIDHAMFGINPTQWMFRFAHPVLTEILQITYASYYFLMIFVGYELDREKRLKEFSFALFCILYGFYLSYIGYLILPSVGPRFTLHDFQSLNLDLPGIWLTEIIRTGLNIGESIPSNVPNPIDYVQRDVFPSGHTQMTLITMYLALHYRIRYKWIVFVIGSLLIISTVYLRYHYVIDLFAGAVFMVFTLWTAPKLFSWWDKVRERMK